MQYRSEIDGLRALAVVPVIFFHAGYEIFSGGFIGVDIFFVLSGFLITSIIMHDIQSNCFKLSDFYERRARRILPALFIMILVCIPFAWVTMLPTQMKDFSQSIVATNLFSSNILFWKETGYFAELAEAKPLLHTWSLAVEEQYYIIFPIMLSFIWSLTKRNLVWVLISLAVFSLFLSEWASHNYPESNFYLAPTRAWELLIGSVLGLTNIKHGTKNSDFLSVLGLASIIFSVITFDSSTRTPSMITCIPVFGTALIILFAGKKTYAAKLLSNKIFVGIGLISYSAYLWHQPIFAFMILKGISFNNSITLMVIFPVIGILSYLSWRLVETPFRNKKIISRYALIVTSLGFSIFFIFFGIAGHITEGYKFRYSKEIMSNWVSGTLSQDYELSTFSHAEAFSIIGIDPSSRWSSARVLRSSENIPSGYVLILGDSHAGHLGKGFAKVLVNERNKEVHILNSTGCKPLINHYMVWDLSRRSELPIQKACRDQVIAWEQFLRNNKEKYELVILSARWNEMVNNENYGNTKITERSLLSRHDELNQVRQFSLIDRIDKLRSGFLDTEKFFTELNLKGYLLTQPPVQIKDLRLGKSLEYFDRARPGRVIAKERHENLIKALVGANLTNSTVIRVLDSFSYFCPDKGSFCLNRDGNVGLYVDTNHLSPAGSERLGKIFLKHLNKN